jgi:tRNA modification GTPase
VTDSHAAPTFAALLTVPGRGAIATIWISGPRAVDAVDRFFLARSGQPVARQPLRQVALGTWHHDRGTEDVIVLRTAADCVEVHTHGGTLAPQSVLAALQSADVHPVSPQAALRAQTGSFWEAESLAAATQAFTLTALDRLLANADGRLARTIDEICQWLGVDSRLSDAAEHLTGLEKSFAFGARLVSGWQITIAGPPNVGKSSLINRLLGYQRSIVFDLPGTTRDVVAETTAVAGWPVRLCDTAGIHSTGDAIERLGVGRAQAAIESADLVIWVSDLSQPWSREQERTLSGIPNVLHVANKADLNDDSGDRLADLRVSLLLDETIEPILAAIENRLFANLPDDSQPFLATPSQAAVVRRALTLIGSGEPAAAGGLLQHPSSDAD